MGVVIGVVVAFAVVVAIIVSHCFLFICDFISYDKNRHTCTARSPRSWRLES